MSDIDEAAVSGFLEAIIHGEIRGWAYKAGSLDPVHLVLVVDGRSVSSFVCDRVRTDVIDERNDVDSPADRSRVGFNVKVPLEFLDGEEHSFHFEGLSGVAADLVPVGQASGSAGRFRLASQVIHGDARWLSDSLKIVGWAVREDFLTQEISGSLNIEVRLNESHSERLVADLSRPDVAALLAYPEYCGYEFTIPAHLLDHVVELRVDIEVSSSGAPLPNSPVFVRSAQRVATPPLEAVRAKEEGSSIGNVDVLPQDRDDPRIQTSALPRHRIFGIADELRSIRQSVFGTQPKVAPTNYENDVEQVISRDLDFNYYLRCNPDVSAAAEDPVIHFARVGWREGRRPAPWFDTEYYLNFNPDVKKAGINPFWHYLVSGRDEGRRCYRIGGHKRVTLENAVPPAEKTRHYSRARAVAKLLKEKLLQEITAATTFSKGLVVSVSQDCYVECTGGIQLFIHDEQRAFNKLEFAYLNISPIDPDLVLASTMARAFYRLVLNGRVIGTCSQDDLAFCLSVAAESDVLRRVCTMHCLLGHNVPRLIEIVTSLAPHSSFLWLHDFSSLCAGYNLLRNDIEFCDAPSIDSVACHLCIYGETRRQHMAEVRHLFENVRLSVVSPSEAAMRIWSRAAELPFDRAIVHAHCVLEDTSHRISEDEVEKLGLAGAPVRVAFIGYPAAHKGWPIFEELVGRVGHLPSYKFFHFLSGNSPSHSGPLITRLSVQTTADRRDAMSQALIDHNIHLALVLSPWPETFSYVTFESFAAGTEVIALSDSGNVADAILREGRGVVIANEEALYEFFETFRAIIYVRARFSNEKQAGVLLHNGTTATLPNLFD